MTAAKRAVLSAEAARLTSLTREKVTAALSVPEAERLEAVTDALETAVQAIDALTGLWAENSHAGSGAA